MATTSKLQKRAKWDVGNTHKLIDLMTKKKFFENCDTKVMKKNNIYNDITQELNKADSGKFIFEKSQVRNKWKKLTETYRNIVNGTAKSGSDSAGFKWEYFNAMHEVMKSRPRQNASANHDGDGIDSIVTIQVEGGEDLTAMENMEKSLTQTASHTEVMSIEKMDEMLKNLDGATEFGSSTSGEASVEHNVSFSLVNDETTVSPSKAFALKTNICVRGKSEKAQKRKRSLDDKQDGILKFLKEEGEKDREMVMNENEKLRKLIAEENSRFISALLNMD